MSERIAVVTGGNTGIGYEIARGLALNQMRVVLACRDLSKAQNAAATLRSEYEPPIDVLHLDLASFRSIRAFAEEYDERFGRLHLLINNAGVFSDRRAYTKDGFEQNMGVNYLGTYLLSRCLFPLLSASKGARMVTVSSRAGLYGRIDWRQPFCGPAGFRGYAASKLAQIWMTMDFAEEMNGQDIRINGVFPGRAATNIWRGDSFMMKLMRPLMLRFSQSPVACAQVALRVALAPDAEIKSGMTYNAKGPITGNKRLDDIMGRKRLLCLTKSFVDG